MNFNFTDRMVFKPPGHYWRPNDTERTTRVMISLGERKGLYNSKPPKINIKKVGGT